jgi:aspartate kinase
MAKYLLVTQHHAFMAQFNDLCTEAEWLLHDKPVRQYDYYYDQIVCLGELFSTTLLHFALAENGINSVWMDVRDILRTNNNYREADVDWAYTQIKVSEQLLPLMQQHEVVITQGFIGSTADNESTTLGREASDYSAAVFANMLQASTLIIWKDVPAVLSADPKRFADATPIEHLSYHEVVEMAYYGAQVIHPKTMKPLFKEGIPLQVKSFIDPSLPGTRIDKKRIAQLPPMLIHKAAQVLLMFQTKDFSFIGEGPIRQWYQLLQQLHLKPNLIQYGAIRLLAVLDDHPEKIAALAQAAEAYFDVTLQRNLQLFTIRHYTEAAIKQYAPTEGVLLTQQTTDTVQYLYQ